MKDEQWDNYDPLRNEVRVRKGSVMLHLRRVRQGATRGGELMGLEVPVEKRRQRREVLIEFGDEDQSGVRRDA